MQDARDSKQEEKQERKRPPHPPKKPRGKHRENTARGTHQPREKKRQQGGGKGKRGKGNPTNPERNRKAPLDARRKEPAKRSEIAWGKHLVPLLQLEEVRAQLATPTTGQAVVETKKKSKNNKNTTHKTCRQSVLLVLVVLKTTVIETMHPPWDPKTEKARSLTGPKLKGLKIQDRSPKAPNLCKFPKHESQTLTKYQTHQSTALRRTQRGGGAHGPPRFSGESLRGTLVPRR